MEFTRLIAAGLSVAVAACGDDSPFLIFEPEGLQPARLEFFDDAPRVSVPENVGIGELFVISIETYGGGCIEAGPTPVKLVGETLNVRPLDDFPDRDDVCSADVRLIDHSVSFQMDAQMTLEVAVHGTRVSEEGLEDIVVSRTVVVGGGDQPAVESDP